MVTRAELAREGRQGAGQRGGVGESAEPEGCPICLSNLSFPIDTNCGHTFCAECILSYWQHDQWPRPARCAVCRSQASNFLQFECLRLSLAVFRLLCYYLVLLCLPLSTQTCGDVLLTTISACLANHGRSYLSLVLSTCK